MRQLQSQWGISHERPHRLHMLRQSWRTLDSGLPNAATQPCLLPAGLEMNAGEFQRQRARIEASRDRSNAWRKRAMVRLMAEAGANLDKPGPRATGYNLPNGKIICIKHRYRSEAEAHDALRQIAAIGQSRVSSPIRAYPCFKCNGWHVTSKL